MIVNLILDEISVTKKKEIAAKMEISNNVKIINITEQKISDVAEKQAALNINFIFTINYKPEIANIELKGKALYMTDEKTKKEILSTWKKEEKIDPKISQPILNKIFTRCNIKALTLANEVNLPPHIPFPRVALKSQIEQPKKAA